MRSLTTLLITLAVVATACGEADTTASSTTVAPTVTTASDEPMLLAHALEQLVAEDNSFGSGHRFTMLLLQSRIDRAAGNATTPGSGRPLTDAERTAIEQALAPLGPTQWIEDPADWRTDDLRPTIAGAAIVGVGEVVFDEDGALVPVSLWCGGLCGIWLTYRLQIVDGQWAVIGTAGPMVIS